VFVFVRVDATDVTAAMAGMTATIATDAVAVAFSVNADIVAFVVVAVVFIAAAADPVGASPIAYVCARVRVKALCNQLTSKAR
jgi:hypothetical protein